MARHFKGNVLDFFGSYYPHISLKDIEENHKGLSQNSHTSFVIRSWYSGIKVGCTHVVLFDPPDSKYIFLGRRDTKKMYLSSNAIIYFFCGVLCRDNYPRILKQNSVHTSEAHQFAVCDAPR
jgi:hypothetical protein